MAEASPPPPPPVPDAETVDRPGRSDVAASRGDAPRTFPCESCGAGLEFHVGQQRLACPYCGFAKELHRDAEARFEEHDFHARLAELAERRKRGAPEGSTAQQLIRCESCGAEVELEPTITSTDCAYCDSPMQRGTVHTARDRIPVDGVLPFKIARQKARENLRRWVRGLWFAPNEFRKRGVQGRFTGAYLPYWTFDALTFNRYTGQRGDHYTVTVGSGQNRRTVTRTRWRPASGAFQQPFDDVVVVAAEGLPEPLLRGLEPWPLAQLVPFDGELLAGFQARTYDVELDAGFAVARERMDEAVRAEVRRRIGGDVQRITSLDTRHEAVTFKHLLLPVWLLTYRYSGKAYRVAVNAGSGEVRGERPWSIVKIALAAAAAVALALVIFAITR